MHRRKSFLFNLIFIVLSSLLVDAQNASTISIDKVKTENGWISGIAGNDKLVLVFKGIPFASPPVGELRWKEPQPVKDWRGIKKCYQFGPNAMQAKPVPFMVWTEEFLIPKNEPISEDCLYLNVWTTAKSTNEKRPVIVFIHGGGFVNGSGSVPIYDGEAMAKKGIVFVTINYRLGIFGFLAHPELTKESPHHASGNYGILDQIAALKWVKKNIAAFGGNPDNVTIAGQSAGSMSVNILDASPVAKGLFAKMIAESGAGVIKGMLATAMPLDSAEKRGLQFQQAAGATDLKDLRNIPAEKLLSLSRGNSVIVDGYVLPESVLEIFRQHKQTDAPLLTGFNGDDVVFTGQKTLDAYKESVRKQFGEDSDQIWKYYPATDDATAKESAGNLSRDLSFGEQNFSWAIMVSEQGKNKVYEYFFNRKVPIFNGATNYGAFHTGEVSYAYDNLKYLNRPLVKEDQELATLMSAYWANFARNGDPNGKGLPYWPAFNEQKGEVMIFDAIPGVKRHPFYEPLEFLYKRGTR